MSTIRTRANADAAEPAARGSRRRARRPDCSRRFGNWQNERRRRRRRGGRRALRKRGRWWWWCSFRLRGGGGGVRLGVAALVVAAIDRCAADFDARDLGRRRREARGVAEILRIAAGEDKPPRWPPRGTRAYGKGRLRKSTARAGGDWHTRRRARFSASKISRWWWRRRDRRGYGRRRPVRRQGTRSGGDCAKPRARRVAGGAAGAARRPRARPLRRGRGGARVGGRRRRRTREEDERRRRRGERTREEERGGGGRRGPARRPSASPSVFVRLSLLAARAARDAGGARGRSRFRPAARRLARRRRGPRWTRGKTPRSGSCTRSSRRPRHPCPRPRHPCPRPRHPPAR